MTINFTLGLVIGIELLAVAAAVGPGVMMFGMPLTFGVLGAGFMARARPRGPRRPRRSGRRG